MLRENQRNELKGLSATLHDAIGPLLVHDDVASLRRLIVHVKDAFKLAECRVTMPDGRVIADSSPGKIKVPTLPAQWANGPLDAEMPVGSGDAAVAQFPVIVPGRGTVIVYLLANMSYPTWARSDMQAGLAVIGAAGMGMMMLLYRKTRSRVAVLGMISDAVVLSGESNDSPEFCGWTNGSVRGGVVERSDRSAGEAAVGGD